MIGEQDHIGAAAAAWIVRLGDRPLEQHERAALERWLAQSPEHRAAFDLASTTWDDLGQAFESRKAMPVRRAGRAWGQRAAFAATILLAVGLGGFWLGNPMILLSADHRTAPGERLTVTLEDGSVVEMDTASAIDVRFDDGERRVDLLAGQAYFTVAAMAGGERRPFVVGANGGTARALGTQFMVDRSRDGVEVTVAEHDVAVTHGDTGEVVVSPGQSVRYDGSGLGPVHTINLTRSTAWRRGRLIFDQVPLSVVADELSRYQRGRIVVASDNLATRRFSGVFDVDDPQTALASITREVGGRRTSVPPFVTVLY